MNDYCPQCRWVIHRPNHPSIGFIRFCRKSCVRDWMKERGMKIDPKYLDVVPVEYDRRSA